MCKFGKMYSYSVVRQIFFKPAFIYFLAVNTSLIYYHLRNKVDTSNVLANSGLTYWAGTEQH